MKHPVYIRFDEFFLFLSNYSLFNNSVSISGFHFSFIPFLLKRKSHKFVFFLSDNQLKSVFEEFSFIHSDFRCLIVPPKDLMDSPYGFSSSSRVRSGLLSSFALNSNLYDGVICDYSLEKENLPLNKKNNGFTINKGVEYDSLLSFLETQNYSRCDFVSSPGDFSVRGLVVDVYSFSKKTPIRINFFDSPPSFFLFSVDSQLFLKKISSYFVSPAGSESSSRLSFANHIKKNFVSVYIKEKHTVFGVGPSAGSFSFNIDVFNYNSYFKNISKNYITKTTSLLFNSAISYKKTFLSPPSYFKKKSVVNHQIKSDLCSSASLGDFLVHRNFGIGVFIGMKTDANKRESLILKYSNDEYVYVSIENLYLVSFYASSLTDNVVLSSLSKGSSWSRRVSLIKKNLYFFVDSLLLSFSEKSKLFREKYYFEKSSFSSFLSLFPHEETKDQACCWNDVLTDLLSYRPMDRLLCGDVGFGKTEIAMRATYVVASSFFQVAIISPTTILALQLFNSFKKRFSNTAISIKMLSRLQPSSEKRRIVTGIKSGNIDVVIGTHSLLSKEIEFKCLGLLVIDEEHRFGVKQKEKLRNLSRLLDILSLSATPIPRTLQQTFNGIRDISYLMSPPLERLPIKTFVRFSNNRLYSSAILYELNRGGQAFVVYNNVKNIDVFTNKLSKIVPQARFDYIHGQLSSGKIESTISSFIKKELDVLVCSTIIEAGIDVAGSNTIIIENSHLLGLAQLYQLRGRVGRSNIQSYSYLLVPKNYKLSSVARKRLKSIEKNSALGSGLNVSRLDLDLRGSGALFGYKQSGNVGFVGKDLYSLLVKESINSALGTKEHKGVMLDEIFVDVFDSYYISENYVPSQSLRFDLYKKIFASENAKELSLIKKSLCDGYGPLTPPVDNLFKTQSLRIVCLDYFLLKLFYKNFNLCFCFDKKIISLDSFIEKTSSYFSGLGFNFLFEKNNDLFLILKVNILNKESSYKIVLDYLNKLR